MKIILSSLRRTKIIDNLYLACCVSICSVVSSVFSLFFYFSCTFFFFCLTHKKIASWAFGNGRFGDFVGYRNVVIVRFCTMVVLTELYLLLPFSDSHLYLDCSREITYILNVRHLGISFLCLYCCFQWQWVWMVYFHNPNFKDCIPMCIIVCLFTSTEISNISNLAHVALFWTDNV